MKRELGRPSLGAGVSRQVAGLGPWSKYEKQVWVWVGFVQCPGHTQEPRLQASEGHAGACAVEGCSHPLPWEGRKGLSVDSPRQQRGVLAWWVPPGWGMWPGHGLAQGAAPPSPPHMGLSWFASGPRRGGQGPSTPYLSSPGLDVQKGPQSLFSTALRTGDEHFCMEPNRSTHVQVIVCVPAHKCVQVCERTCVYVCPCACVHKWMCM